MLRNQKMTAIKVCELMLSRDLLCKSELTP